MKQYGRIGVVLRGAFMGVLMGASMLRAQTSDTDFSRPLEEVLTDLETKYEVQIKYNQEDIGGLVLAYANWRLVPGDVELSLKNVLAPFDYLMVKQGEGVYKVKPYQYHLLTPEAGAASLEYLQTQYADPRSWEERKAGLRQCMVEALGISTLPRAETPEVLLTNKRVHAGYSIVNIALETIPGLYVTGSIYQPHPPREKLPVILSPNGHFGDGRYRQDEQLRCAALARMGAMVVSYDLFGWGESRLQVGGKAHRKSIAHTIQTFNAIRILDYLLGWQQVDTERVGITGASGGGSQTMLVSALDDRISVSVPVVMTSSFHSGGCPCESGRGIHLCGGRTNNAEIAAMMAPKPQLIISDGKDWTFQVPEVEFPFVQRTYAFYQAAKNVENVHFAEEGHDYGFSKRGAMYPFMARHLGLDLQAIQNGAGAIDESTITTEAYSELYVFGSEGKLPPSAIKNLEKLYEILERNEP